MAEEKPLSPEEKLLRVIQGKKGGGTGGAAASPSAPPSAAVAAAEVSPPAAPSHAAGPVIADVEEPQPEQTVEVPAATAAAEPAAAQPAAETDRTLSPRIAKLRRTDDPVIRRANLLLMVAAVLIAVLIGVQIAANATYKPLPEALPGKVMLPPEPPTDLPPVAEYTKLFEDRPWFPPSETPTPTNQSVAGDSQAPLRQAIRLVAVSQVSDGVWEAILVDSGTGRMHFLRAGGKMMAGEKGKERELTLVRAERDCAVLSDGKEEIVLK